jgi:hypothetical protein
MDAESERIWVHSPGGWVPPSQARPGWGWAPEGGATPRPDRMPMWLRIAYRSPFLDRVAYSWMWLRGGWDVLPPGGVVTSDMIVSDPPPGSVAVLKN